MATEFLRLYKELCKEEREEMDSGKVKKLTSSSSSTALMYPSTRLSVMSELGYDVGLEAPIRVKPMKYHGKMARRSIELRIKLLEENPAAKKEKLNPNANRDRAAEKKKLHDIMLETERINKVAQEIEKLTTAGKPIGEELIRKLANDKKNRSAAYAIKKLPPISSTSKREISLYRKDLSKHKWTLEERDKLNSLFQELEKPSSIHLQAWNLYYKNFSNRFRSLFTNRSETEVIEKLQGMILMRQMREPGEEKFWKEKNEQSLTEKTTVKSNFSKASRF